MSKHDSVIKRFNEATFTRNLAVIEVQAQAVADLLQLYGDALERLGDGYFTEPNIGEDSSDWLDRELTLHKEYARDTIEE